MNAPHPTDLIRTTAPRALWRIAAAFMHLLHALFGAPEDVAARHTLRFEAHKLMTSWLRAGETMMRRLLIIEAAAYAKPNTRPLLRASRKRTRKAVGFTPDAPEKWRVSFRCFTSERRLPAGKHSNRQDAGAPKKRITRENRWCAENLKPAKLRSAWPLAERYEALLRVFNNPLAYARRLSRRLHATLHRLHDLYRAPPEAADRVERFADFTETARQSWNTS